MRRCPILFTVALMNVAQKKGEKKMTTKAFLVGINDYSPVGPSGLDLQGCVNDAKDMANTLVICGFAPASIRICTNKNATKAGIVNGLAWLIRGSKKGDSLVFYYSGHGSQVVDTNGDEIDKKDEIICPHDIDFQSATYITDDDLKKIFSKLPAGANLEVILDSCHSGSGTREIMAMKEMAREVKVGIRYMAPPLDYSFHIDYLPNLPKKGLLKVSSGQKQLAILPGLNHTLWAACRDFQTSEETDLGGSVRGAFTYNFCQVLRRTNGNIKRKDLDSIVTSAIRRGGFAQVPQLETSAPELLDKPFK